ncbi:3-phenylpropionic acid transporter [Bacillus sp. FJAT-27231]|uniref:MFS transporter n=1 Tax=Bacillus sp. FJAT-27231 TaxID=1679168 RepID=UPI0006716C82|nr:MFS transporter [Bacillus sp. FJAT-27231]KMY55564.1 3-phenylpropionic acid transporter [Bacillus sp. FJAT-27231]
MYRAQTWLSLNFFAFFFTWGVFLPYWTAWLIADKGITVESASTIIAAGLFIRSFSTFFIFPSLSAKFSIGTLIKAFPAVSTLLLLVFIPFDSFYAIMTAMILFSLVYPLMLPLTESIGTMMQNEGVQYGKSRSWGSIGYAIALVVVGGVTASFGDTSIIYIMMLGSLFMIGAAFYYTPASLKKRSKTHSVPFRSLFHSKRFVIAMVISLLVQGAHASYYSYGFIYLQDLGVSNTWGGIILNVAVVSEILFFIVADRLLKQTRISSMFLISAVASIVRWSLLFLFPNVAVYIATQLLHSLTFALAHFAFIRLLYEEFDSREIPAAQGMYASLSMGLSSSLLTVAGGYLYKEEPGLAFLGMAFVLVPAIGCIFYFKKKFESSVHS